VFDQKFAFFGSSVSLSCVFRNGGISSPLGLEIAAGREAVPQVAPATSAVISTKREKEKQTPNLQTEYHVALSRTKNQRVCCPLFTPTFFLCRMV
jgi:hypothetical protein